MRIRTPTIYLDEIVREAAAGALVAPKFQRPYVWTKNDVLKLCVSILRGYPIGSIMTWQPSPDEPLKIARTRLGPIPLNADHPDRRYLLDGQNRIASMAWAFFSGNSPLPNDLSEQEHETWGKGERLCVDLQRRCFEFVPASAGSEGFLFPVSAFFDTQLAHTALIEKLTKTWLGVPQADQDAAIQWYKHCEQAFKSAKLVETIFEGATREEAREAFLHICQAGVAMSADDFDAAIGYNCTD